MAAMRVTAYDFGRMVVDGAAFTRDLIIHPDRIQGSWWRGEGHRLDMADLETLWERPPRTLVIGTGYYGNMRVPDIVRRALADRGVEVHAAPTGEAVTLFNALRAERGDTVAGAFHLTC